MKGDQVRVLVTGVGGGGIGEQIYKALNLSESKYTIIGTDITPYSKGLMEVDIPYLVPPAYDENYIPSLVKICKSENVDIIFCGSEPEIKVLSLHRHIFEEMNIIFPLNPEEVLDICFDKAKTMEFLERNNYSYPKTYKVNSLECLKQITSIPVVLKPSVGGSGSANTFIAQNKEQLILFTQYLLSLYEEFIVQEYVGHFENEFTVGVLLDLEGNLINSIAIKRNILGGLGNKLKVPNLTDNKTLGEYLVISSGISQGEVGTFPEVTRECERLAIALGCRGPVNIQCRFIDGKVYVFEINPRFSGTTSLRALVGYNEPDILIKKYLLNQEIETRFMYKEGKIMRGLSETYMDKNRIMKYNTTLI